MTRSPSFFSARVKSNARVLARVLLDGVWYFCDDRLCEFRQCDDPHERIMFDELLTRRA
jgi:hypothetical protein